MRVLVTGATGYIGGRLVPALLARGHDVRCAARTPSKLDDRPWRREVEVAQVDVFDRASLDEGVAGCEAVYFLIHSMDGGDDFAERDRRAAANVRDACADAGVRRIVYLGGLGDPHDDLSDHLRSRHEVGQVLADGPVPVIELRAALIIGAGSASFEMLRNLVDVLPVMTTPRWVETRVQPIGIGDVLHHLCTVLEAPEAAGEILEVGGPDVLTYRELMEVYAEAAGLPPRWIVPVPMLTPKLSSLWVGLVTPLPAGLARPLIDSLVNEVVVRDGTTARLMPHDALPFRTTVELALRYARDLALPGAETAVDEARAEPARPDPADATWSGGAVYEDVEQVHSTLPADAVFGEVAAIGGRRGYGSRTWLLRARGLLDRLVGGAGFRRGRPPQLRAGDQVDFWRVVDIERPHLLRLRAELRLPGVMWLELRVRPGAPGVDAVPGADAATRRSTGSVLEVVTRYHPRGLTGRLYWFGLRPLHRAGFAALGPDLITAAESR